MPPTTTCKMTTSLIRYQPCSACCVAPPSRSTSQATCATQRHSTTCRTCIASKKPSNTLYLYTRFGCKVASDLYITIILLRATTGCQLGDGAAEAFARALATNSVLQCLDLRGIVLPDTVHNAPTCSQTTTSPRWAPPFWPTPSPSTTARSSSSNWTVRNASLHLIAHKQPP